MRLDPLMESHIVPPLALVMMVLMLPPSPLATQQPPPAGSGQAVERLGPDLLRVGRAQVNTATREVTVSGTINRVTTLEFLANTPNGLKAYESALTLDTDAIAFNTALILIGLERAHVRVSGPNLDGDRVDLFVDLPGARPRRIRADRLIYDRATNQEVPEDSWIYTGSSFLPGGRYWAESDGVLIGFIHSGAAVIDRPVTIGVGRYGSIVLNPNLGLQPGMAVTLTVKALEADKSPSRRP